MIFAFLLFVSVEWKPGGIDGEHAEHDMYLTIFQEAVMSKMQSMINASIEQRPELNARNKTIQEVLKEAVVHVAHCRDLIADGAGRSPPSGTVDRIRAMMTAAAAAGGRHGPIIVRGGPGSGKTSVITAAYRQCTAWFGGGGGPTVRIVRFSGVTPRASYNLELLRIICEQLTCVLQPNGLCVPLDASFDPLYVSDWFQTLLKRFEDECRASTLVLFVDDLHRLNPLDSDIVAGLSWLPVALPANVHVLCTTLYTPDELKMTPLQKDRFRGPESYVQLPDADIGRYQSSHHPSVSPRVVHTVLVTNSVEKQVRTGFGLVWTGSDRVRPGSDLFGRVWAVSDRFGTVRTGLDRIGQVQTS